MCVHDRDLADGVIVAVCDIEVAPGTQGHTGGIIHCGCCGGPPVPSAAKCTQRPHDGGDNARG